MESNRTTEGEGERGGRRLDCSWSIWEKYQASIAQNHANYQESMWAIFKFGSLETLAQIWRFTSYGEPSQLLYDTETKATKKFRVTEQDGTEKTVDGLLLFRTGIMPKWEDPMNSKGCSFQCDLKELLPSMINSVWRDLVFAVVGENFPHSELVNGFRLLDRLKKHNTVKIELWLSIGMVDLQKNTPEFDSVTAKLQEIKEYFHRVLIKTQQMSIHQIYQKDHFTVIRVN